MALVSTASARTLRPQTRAPQAQRQRGSSLLFSLIALAVLALAAVAVTRSVNTGSLIVGNLGFKQEATLANDRAAEAAMTWIQNNIAGTTLHADIPASGYYATSLDVLDPTGKKTAATRAVVDWNMDTVPCASVGGAFSTCLRPSGEVTINGNRSRFVISRLCSVAGDPNAVGNSCTSPLFAATPDDGNRAGYDYAKATSLGDISTAPLYRIVVRTLGARGTTSFTEAIVHF